MPNLKLREFQSYNDAEMLYNSLNNLSIANEALEIDCCEVDFIDATCTLALLVISRLWFRWTGHETRIVGLQADVHEHICRLNLFNLTGETLVDGEPLEYEVTNHFGNINDRRIVPQFIPSHPSSNRLVMEDVLDAVEESIDVWFKDARLIRDVSMILSELGENIIHSNDYGYLLLQRYRSKVFPGGSRLVIAISDLGIGIRQSLVRTNLIKPTMTDSECIQLALQHRVTGTNENRGIGLEEVRRLALQSTKHAELRIRSGTGAVNIQQNQIFKEDHLATIPGVQITLVLESETRHDFGVWA